MIRSRVTKGRMVYACARCRNHELKCDSSRPCVMCQHAEVACQPRDPSTIKRRGRRVALSSSQLPEDSQNLESRQNLSLELDAPGAIALEPELDIQTGQAPPILRETPARQHDFGANNSSIGFAVSVFRQQAVDTNDTQETLRSPSHDDNSRKMSQSTWSLKTMRIPPQNLMHILVESYLERMHWFICIFHEPTLREDARLILAQTQWNIDQRGTVLAILAVAALGLQCVTHDPSWSGHNSLKASMLDAQALTKELISEVSFHLLDLVENSQVETVQICLMLGTYYFYHGSPNLAWTIVGMATRTAYALNLHSCRPSNGNQILEQVKRLCWNHISVADTFSSMIYGRPTSLDGAFITLHSLDELKDTLVDNKIFSHTRSTQSRVTLLTFHVLKQRLYQIILRALQQFRTLHPHNPLSVDDLNHLLRAVKDARRLLDEWQESLPAIFDFRQWQEDNPSTVFDLNYRPDMAATKRKLVLQARTLQVTYDSALIFIYRPLLEYKISSVSLVGISAEFLQIVHQVLEVSMAAALRVSKVPVANMQNNFCISFVLMHYFTAGVILCIPLTTRPFSDMAQNARVSILRIIRESRSLKENSQIAHHVERLLTGLFKFSLQRELEIGLESGPSHDNTPTLVAALDEVSPDQERDSSHNFSFNSIPPLYLHNQTLSASMVNPTHSPGNTFATESSGTAFSELDPFFANETLRGQIEPHLEEVFEEFGQSLFNLIPNDQHSAWNWASNEF